MTTFVKPKRLASCLLICPLLCMLGAAAATAEPVVSKGGINLTSTVLDLPGKVKHTFFEDIDRDGLVDIIAVCGGETAIDPSRNLFVFFQRSDGFDLLPDLDYDIPEDVSVIDLGDVRSDVPGQELLLLHANGVRWLALPRPPVGAFAATRLLAGGGETLITTDPVFAGPKRDGVSKRDFARPRDGAGMATLFIPRTTGYRVYTPEDGYTNPQDFAVQHFHRVYGTGYGIKVADLHLADMNGDGREDLVFTHLDRLWTYDGGEARFADTPGLELNLDVITLEDRESPFDLEDLISFNIADFDNDGLADLLVNKRIIRKKAVINDKEQYQLYRNRGGRFELLPDQAFVLKSFGGFDPIDLDGDERIDIATGYFELTIGNIIKALLARRFVIELSFFLYSDEGFPDQPNEKRDFKVRFSLSNMDDNFAPAVSVEGDYDGDGRRDFLMQANDETVEIFRGDGRKGRLFEKKASIELKTFACDEVHVEDFNGDGLSDMVFSRFPDREPYSNTWINVLLSRGTGR